MNDLIKQEIGTDIDVKGYRILLKAIDIPEITKGGIYLHHSYRNQERRGHNVGRVLKMGPMAYQPLEKFGGSPYCQIGDWVIYSSYERDEIYIDNHLCFFINDERIYAVIPDITAIIKDVEAK